MSREERLKRLGNFLKSRRARISPSDVGLPVYDSRRRTKGLKREEVSYLAGVSMSWYTWLEQGRDIQVSKEVLISISKVLQLSEDEHDHLMYLAASNDQFHNDMEYDEILSFPLHSVVNGFLNPCMIINSRADILVWNDNINCIFIDFAQLPNKDRNFIWQLFSNPQLQAKLVNWEQFACQMVAVYRGFVERNYHDEWMMTFVQKLMDKSPLFKSEWEKYEIKKKSNIIIEVKKPDKGQLRYDVSYFQHMEENFKNYMIIFTPYRNT